MDNYQETPFVQEPKKPKEGFLILSILAIVFGGLAMLFSWLNIFSVAFGIVVMVFGMAGLTLGITTFILNIENRKIFSLIGFGLGIMGFLVASVMLLLGLFLFTPGALGSYASKSSRSNTAAASSSTPNSSDNLTDNGQGPTTGEVFSWTYSSFLQLKVGDMMTGVGGDNYDGVIKKYGQPTSSQDDSVDGTTTRAIRYDTPNNADFTDMRYVSLTFTKQSDGTYLLSDAREDSLGAKSTDIAGTNCPFKPSDYEKLVVGDSDTGVGGGNLADILKKYGSPRRN